MHLLLRSLLLWSTVFFVVILFSGFPLRSPLVHPITGAMQLLLFLCFLLPQILYLFAHVLNGAELLFDDLSTVLYSRVLLALLTCLGIRLQRPKQGFCLAYVAAIPSHFLECHSHLLVYSLTLLWHPQSFSRGRHVHFWDVE